MGFANWVPLREQHFRWEQSQGSALGIDNKVWLGLADKENAPEIP